MCSALMHFVTDSALLRMCTLPMYETLKDRSVKRFSTCLLASFVFVFLLFAALCFMSLSLYGSDVSSNILQLGKQKDKRFLRQDLPRTPWGDCARVAMGLSVLAVYPIYLESMVAPLRHAEAWNLVRLFTGTHLPRIPRTLLILGKKLQSFPLPRDERNILGWKHLQKIFLVGQVRALRHHKPLQLPSPASSSGFEECEASRGSMVIEPSCNSLPSQRSLSRAHLERIKMHVLGFRLRVPLRPSQLAIPLVVGASALGGNGESSSDGCEETYEKDLSSFSDSHGFCFCQCFRDLKVHFVALVQL
eukprot:Skav207206  [mRNA]  locus=scaffold2886:61011:64568:- [translate_table: standard]